MRRIASIAAGAAVILWSAAAFQPALSQDNTMPERFLGLWQPTTGGAAPSCAPNDFDIRIDVLPDRMNLHEGGCSYSGITLLAPGSDDGPVEVGLSCAQEDSEWTDTQRWRIADSGGNAILAVEGRTPGREFQAEYGLCRAAGDTAAAPREPQCYEQGFSTLTITPSPDGSAEIGIESVQGGAHMCSLSGTAVATETGLLYTETIDGVGECRLSVVIDRDGNVRIEDPDWTCKNYYCGMRAAFEHIEFSGTDRRPC